MACAATGPTRGAAQETAVVDMAKLVKNSQGSLPLSKLLHAVTPHTKRLIMSSGKGLEGFVAQFNTVFAVEGSGGEKMVAVIDPAYVNHSSFSTTFNNSSASVSNVEEVSHDGGSSEPAPHRIDAVNTAAADATTATPEAADADANVSDAPGGESPAGDEPAASAAPLAKKEDPNKQLRVMIMDLIPNKGKYYYINDIYNRLYKNSTTVKYDDFLKYVRASPEYFWHHKGVFSQRFPDQMNAPAVIHDETPKKPKIVVAQPKKVRVVEDYGGWGCAANVPVAEDIYEILKYVPIHWTNMGNLGLPPAVKKKHVRSSSMLTWFARQPWHFELRMVAATLEVRRSIVLHPDAHNLTKEKAEELLRARIKVDDANGGPEAMRAARDPRTAKAVPGLSTGVATFDNLTKIMLRVCPGYYISSGTIQRRATKKMSLEDMLGCVEGCPQLEKLSVTVQSRPTIFFRRKTGVDTASWLDEFREDLQSAGSAENMGLLVAVMTRSCAHWDRTHFLYVRLPDDVKVQIGGFDGMVALLRRHPKVFLVGEFFVKRIDSSDSSSADEPEPTSSALTHTKMLEDNPYHLSIEMAMVFHYLTPEEGSTSLSHYVECCSPAMKSVMPPRIITLIQLHPEMFEHREVSPGTFTVSRAQTNTPGGAIMDDGVLVSSVVKLIPVRGIDVGHLTTGLTTALRRAVMHHYGADGAAALVAAHPELFHVVKNAPYTTIFLKNPTRE
jgi:hypothetical protein